MNNISIIKKKDCTGCFACKSICSNQSISKEIINGFYFPKVKNTCLNCGRCLKVCPQYNLKEKANTCLSYSYTLNSEQIMKSASGGAFISMANYFIKNNGIVYGASYNSKMKVEHIRVEEHSDLIKLQGSKYVQSDIESIFFNICNDILNDKNVLVSGTPCQIESIRKYLDIKKMKTDKVLFVDIICHGVPSPIIWNEYINFMQSKHRKNVKNFIFRNKYVSWENYNTQLIFDDGSIVENKIDQEIYINLFCKDVIIRPSCFNCKFCNLKRTGDITIGDCWGIKSTNLDIYNQKGVSLVLKNTNSELVEHVFGYFDAIGKISLISIEEFMQHNLYGPTVAPLDYKQFWDDYNSMGFKGISINYGGYTWLRYLKKIIKMVIK